MAEYIEREAVVKYIRSREGNFIDDMGKGWSNGMDAAASMCEKFPAADVVEVVRCKDCKRCFKHTTRRYKQTMWLCMRHDFNVNVHPDDFCSYGERKETDGSQV